MTPTNESLNGGGSPYTQRRANDTSGLRKSHWIIICIVSNCFWMWQKLRLIIPPVSYASFSVKSTQDLMTSVNSWENNEKDTPPTSFTIRSKKTFAWYQGGSSLQLFHSFVPYNEGYQVVYNHRAKVEGAPKRGEVYLETEYVSSTFQRTNNTKRLGEKGYSDARAFAWNGGVYCLTWKINWRSGGYQQRKKDRFMGLDFNNFLINLVTGKEYQLDHCVGGYRGKNWIPLVYQEKLYVVHRMSPELKWFVYDAIKGCAPPTSNGTQEDVDQWRGGSAFVTFGSHSMISMGHQTVDGDTHLPFLMHVDMITNQSTKVEMSDESKADLKGILDPTSLWWEDSYDNNGKRKLFMGTIHTTGRWKTRYFHDNHVFNSSIYEVELIY